MANWGLEWNGWMDLERASHCWLVVSLLVIFCLVGKQSQGQEEKTGEGCIETNNRALHKALVIAEAQPTMFNVVQVNSFANMAINKYNAGEEIPPPIQLI